jgi:ABC-type dipeptide/oligopeptide/nickel transport system permease component
VLKAVTAFQLSCPPYFQGLLVLVFFAAGTGTVLPLSFVSGQGDFAYFSDDPVRWAKAMWMPMVLVGLPLAAYVARITDVALGEQLQEDYMRTARAKGVPRRAIIWRHGFSNALIPVVTVVGLYVGILIGNSVLTEIVFNRPGLGKVIVSALTQRDYTMLQGMMVIYCFLIVVVNLITDISYGLIDPRVKQ